MIVKPTVNELLNYAENRYALVIATSKRARQIANGDKPMVEIEDKSPVTKAANEIVAKKVSICKSLDNIEDEVEEEEKNIC